MTNKQTVLKIFTEKGKSDALDLRARAPEMTGTEIIAEETKIPGFEPQKDYSGWNAGAPVTDGGQVYTLLQPHNAAHYPNTRPADLPALWRVSHTTDAEKARPWVKPTSTSDIYLKGECMVWTDGTVYRAKRDTNFSPDESAADWEAAV